MEGRSKGRAVEYPAPGLASFKETPLVGEKDFPGVEVAEAAQFLIATVEADHPSVRNKQLTKLVRANDPAGYFWQDDAWDRKRGVVEYGRIHVLLLPAIA